MSATGENPEIDAAFWSMLRPDTEYLPSGECIEGDYYWGFGRSIGEIAICRGRGGSNFPNAMQFEGLRNKMGIDKLFIELHYDDNPNWGTFAPLVDLGKAIDSQDEGEVMSWLLDETIDLVETRIAWLRRLPEPWNLSIHYPYVLEDEITHLEALQTDKRLGFSHSPMPTFKEMIAEQRRKKAEADANS